MSSQWNSARAIFAACIACVLLPLAAWAELPDKPIRIIVPYAAGGGSDALARRLADRLREGLGQPVLVENKVGANGIIGTEQLVRAEADGHTLALVVNSHYINPLLTRKMPYDTINDFSPVTAIASSPVVLVVRADLPVISLQDLAALMRGNPNIATYGSSDSSGRLLASTYMKAQGIHAVHVGYKGGAEVVTSIIQGAVTTGFVSVATAHQLVTAGRIKALAVTGTQRTKSLPTIPTFNESGVTGFEQAIQSFMLLAPKMTPKARLETIQKEVARALKSQEMGSYLALVDAMPIGNSPDEFARQMESDYQFWTHAGKEAGLTAE